METGNETYIHMAQKDVWQKFESRSAVNARRQNLPKRNHEANFLIVKLS
jgi:hypothetical protein